MTTKDQSLFLKTGEVLPKLVQMGLITDIECRKIVSADNAIDRQAAVYKVMASKLKKNVANAIVVKMLQVITSGIQNSSDESEEKAEDVIDRSAAVIESHWVYPDTKNPLLIATVVLRIFEYLPFSIIKKFRLVCQEWNSAGELLLKKRGIIHLKPDGLRAERFGETFTCSDNKLPFSAFKISSSCDSSWRVSELEKFCATWGNNIKELRIYTLGFNINANGNKIKTYDVTSWIENMPTLENLTISTSTYDANRSLKVQWNYLESILILQLSDCNVFVDCDNITKIKPLQLSLKNVNFKHVKKTVDINLAELIDFSKAREVVIRDVKNVKFELTNIIFKVERLYLDTFDRSNVNDILDWEGSTGHIHLLELEGQRFLKKADLEIEQMVLHYSTIDLDALPPTIEKLYFIMKVKIVGYEQIQLPRLNFLRLDDPGENNNFSDMKYFQNCRRLIELQLRIRSSCVTLNLNWVPKSVKQLYINYDSSDINIVEDTNMNELDTVIFETQYNCNIDYDIATKLVSNIKNLKVLVVSSIGGNPFSGGKSTDIIKFVGDNQYLQKIVFGWRGPWSLNKDVQFNTTVFSNFVDKESNFYVFEKLIGKAISFSNFQTYGKMFNFKTSIRKERARRSYNV